MDGSGKRALKGGFVAGAPHPPGSSPGAESASRQSSSSHAVVSSAIFAWWAMSRPCGYLRPRGPGLDFGPRRSPFPLSSSVSSPSLSFFSSSTSSSSFSSSLSVHNSIPRAMAPSPPSYSLSSPALAPSASLAVAGRLGRGTAVGTPSPPSSKGAAASPSSWSSSSSLAAAGPPSPFSFAASSSPPPPSSPESPSSSFSLPSTAASAAVTSSCSRNTTLTGRSTVEELDGAAAEAAAPGFSSSPTAGDSLPGLAAARLRVRRLGNPRPRRCPRPRPISVLVPM
mmetsp:Transcript_26472/g.78333  ORF Transcript_26472/g.78333 Transcript_26472/m.78333 type:complete len:283 (-) Transcript_26472:67-915(-)